MTPTLVQGTLPVGTIVYPIMNNANVDLTRVLMVNLTRPVTGEFTLRNAVGMTYYEYIFPAPIQGFRGFIVHTHDLDEATV